MKYIVVLGDGMSDEPIEALGGKTPLEAANTPAMDALASGGILGMVQNVPEGMHPGSEVANLSVMGYDPKTDFTGRSPLEALSVGVKMEPDDIIFRCNVVRCFLSFGRNFSESAVRCPGSMWACSC